MDIVRLDRSKFQPQDLEAADFIEINLLSLQTGAEAFRWTVDFYLHIRELKRSGLHSPRKVAWTKIAGRNGAIEAYGFSMVMQVLGELLTPSIRVQMDYRKKKKATGLFAEQFPQIAGIRNSTAHPGQLIASPDQMAKHRLGGTGVFIADMMRAFDDRLEFSATFKEKVAAYELSSAKAEALAEVARLYSSAFFPLEDAMFAQHRAKPQASDRRRQQG